MKRFLPCITALGLCVLGCNKPKPEAAPAPAPAAPTSIEAQSAPAPSAASTPAQPGEAPAAAEEPASLTEINRALNAYSMGQLKEPNTLEDLVKAGYIKKLPTPPPGKKFALNPAKTAVLIVDK